jgi:hypothetical protein
VFASCAFPISTAFVRCARLAVAPQRRPMSSLARHRGSCRTSRPRRRARICLPSSSAVAGSSLIGARPRHGNPPAAGCRLLSEVTSHDVGNFTVSPSHAPGTRTAGPRPCPPGHKNERSNARRCAIVVAGASTARRRCSSTSRRSTTCTRSHTAARIRRGTSSSRARGAIVSRETSCRPTSSLAIRGQDRISSRMREPCIER